ncbi:hypothetical protein [Demequina sp. NBRC 110053]|uniref:LppM family (lipo)protein n=1 Tax=Demequina sp. NBRC 110053 TaxID=1570342 RepID=UPI000A005495|nr:hypothetical protein [Demequina sp. NBRC 110053]
MRRATGWAGVAAVVAVALTGCVRVTSDTTFTEDLTFSQHAVVAFDESVASQFSEQQGLGLDLESLAGDAQDSPELQDLQERYPGAIEVAEYDDGELTGVEITITDLPIDELQTAAQEAAGLGAAASIEVIDDDYVVTLSRPEQLDLSDMGVTESSLELAASAVDIAVTYTFPGLVEEANAGDISGNTVTLSLVDLATVPEIRIVAGASDQFDWGPWLKWGGFALAFVLIVGGATALVIQDRRKRRESTLPPPLTSTDPHGPGMLGAEPTPPAARPLEGDDGDAGQPPHRPS